jgi:hypothetical protein
VGAIPTWCAKEWGLKCYQQSGVTRCKLTIDWVVTRKIMIQ